MNLLENKVALVTGASKGIGKQIALAYAKEGAMVAFTDLNRDQVMEETEKELLSVGVKAKGYASNAASFEDSERVVEEIVKEFGRVDILVNNAGFGAFGDFAEADLITELNMVNLNVCAVHTLTKLYLADMYERDSGYILNVSSIAGFMPGPHMATYHATKAYVLKLTQSIYEEVKKQNKDIKICALCPGPIETPFLDRANVRFKTKTMTASEVAKYAIDNMFKGKYMILPGMNNKMIRFLSKIVPDRIIGKIVYNSEEARQ